MRNTHTNLFIFFILFGTRKFILITNISKHFLETPRKFCVCAKKKFMWAQNIKKKHSLGNNKLEIDCCCYFAIVQNALFSSVTRNLTTTKLKKILNLVLGQTLTSKRYVIGITKFVYLFL